MFSSFPQVCWGACRGVSVRASRWCDSECVCEPPDSCSSRVHSCWCQFSVGIPTTVASWADTYVHVWTDHIGRLHVCLCCAASTPQWTRQQTHRRPGHCSLCLRGQTGFRFPVPAPITTSLNCNCRLLGCLMVFGMVTTCHCCYCLHAPRFSVTASE